MKNGWAGLTRPKMTRNIAGARDAATVFRNEEDVASTWVEGAGNGLPSSKLLELFVRNTQV